MADLYPVAGARFYIGAARSSQAADFEPTDFDAEAWQEVDGWETAGTVGDSAETITTQLINRGRDVKQKGTRNAGSMENQFAVIAGDAGQTAMKDAEKTSNNYAFKIEWDDVPEGGTSGTVQYFVGLVMSWQDAGGGANNVRMKSATVEINSNIAETAAA